MAETESVSSSLIQRFGLQDDDISAVDAVIDGESESVILYRQGLQVRAWLNICPHAGRRLDYAPGRFLRDQGHLVCAAHGASFELNEGRCIAGPCRGAQLRMLRVDESADGTLGFHTATSSD